MKMYFHKYIFSVHYVCVSQSIDNNLRDRKRKKEMRREAEAMTDSTVGMADS